MGTPTSSPSKWMETKWMGTPTGSPSKWMGTKWMGTPTGPLSKWMGTLATIADGHSNRSGYQLIDEGKILSTKQQGLLYDEAVLYGIIRTTGPVSIQFPQLLIQSISSSGFAL